MNGTTLWDFDDARKQEAEQLAKEIEPFYTKVPEAVKAKMPKPEPTPPKTRLDIVLEETE